jgi:hypothetical protein
MGGMKIENVNRGVLLLGDNYFESGVINIGAGGTVAAGTILTRGEDDKFTPVEDPQEDSLLAVMPFDITNDKAAAADLGFRALVQGRVRRDMLRVNGQPITNGQSDTLRMFGILPVKVTDLSHLDNQ